MAKSADAASSRSAGGGDRGVTDPRLLESRLEQLTRKVLDLERRLSALEGSSVVPQALSREGEATPGPSPATREATESELAAVLSFTGRALLALGGAYLLRAFTESGFLSQAAGVSLGFVYAFSWIVLAHRAGSAGKTASAALYVGSAVLIGYPLLWETTLRLRILGADGSAAALVGFTVPLLVVVRRWKLSSAAWLTLLAADATALALLFGTRAVAPFALALVAFGLAGLWLGYGRGWPGLQWVTAGLANLAVLMVTLGVAIPSGNVSVPAAVSVQLALFLGYFASFFWRSAVERMQVGRFEIAQAIAATLIGYGGAAIAAEGPSRAAAMVLGIAAALVSYGSGLRWLRWPEVRTNGLLFSGLASALTLLATGSAGPASAYLWGTLAVLAFALGRVLAEPAFSHVGSVYLLAAGIASGLFHFAAYALGAPSELGWPQLSLAGLFVFAAAIASCGIEAPGRLPGLIALSVAVSGAGAVSMLLLTPILAGHPGDSIDAAILATLRTAILALAAIGLGALGAGRKLREAVWLTYGLLALNGIKLVIEDFPRGRAQTLFLGLLAYGAALIVAPRLARNLP